MSPENINRSNNIVNQFVNDFKTHILPYEKEWCFRQYIDKDPQILCDKEVQHIMVKSISTFTKDVVNPENHEVKDTFVRAIIEDFIPQIPYKNSIERKFIDDLILEQHRMDPNNPRMSKVHEKLSDVIYHLEYPSVAK